MSRASRRVQKYLKARITWSDDNGILSTYFPKNNKAETLTVQDLQSVLDERAIARQTVKQFDEQISELQEQNQQLKRDLMAERAQKAPTNREMRLQEKLNAIGTDEAVAQMKFGNRQAQEAWQEFSPEYRGLSLAEAVRLLKQQIAGATGKATSEHARADRLESRNAALLATINEAAGRSADGVSLIKQAREYQKKRHPAEGASRQQLFYAAFALLTDSPDGYPFGHSSWQGITRRGRGNQLAHAGACIAALIDRLPQQPASMKRRLPENAIDFAPEN